MNLTTSRIPAFSEAEGPGQPGAMAHPGKKERENGCSASQKNALAAGALSRARNHQQLLQLDLAAKLSVTQPHIAGIEQKSDMLLSTLQRYVQALGGELDLIARFGDISFHLTRDDHGPAASGHLQEK